jgi:hypothetical protein
MASSLQTLSQDSHLSYTDTEAKASKRGLLASFSCAVFVQATDVN